MARYKVPVNTHRYCDASDSPRVRTFYFLQSGREELERELIDWRERNGESGLTTQAGRRFYLGMIHWNAIEPAC